MALKQPRLSSPVQIEWRFAKKLRHNASNAVFVGDFIHIRTLLRHPGAALHGSSTDVHMGYREGPWRKLDLA